MSDTAADASAWRGENLWLVRGAHGRENTQTQKYIRFVCYFVFVDGALARAAGLAPEQHKFVATGS